MPKTTAFLRPLLALIATLPAAGVNPAQAQSPAEKPDICAIMRTFVTEADRQWSDLKGATQPPFVAYESKLHLPASRCVASTLFNGSMTCRFELPDSEAAVNFARTISGAAGNCLRIRMDAESDPTPALYSSKAVVQTPGNRPLNVTVDAKRPRKDGSGHRVSIDFSHPYQPKQ